MASFCKPFTKAEIRYFEHSLVEEAQTWLMEELAGVKEAGHDQSFAGSLLAVQWHRVDFLIYSRKLQTPLVADFFQQMEDLLPDCWENGVTQALHSTQGQAAITRQT